jgi:hypothetical protein
MLQSASLTSPAIVTGTLDWRNRREPHTLVVVSLVYLGGLCDQLLSGCSPPIAIYVDSALPFDISANPEATGS